MVIHLDLEQKPLFWGHRESTIAPYEVDGGNENEIPENILGGGENRNTEKSKHLPKKITAKYVKR
jgi:hypothetical protein